MSTSAASVWRTPDGAVPLIAWRDAQLAALAGVIDAAVRGWEQAWGLSPDPLATCCAAACADVDIAKYQALGATGAAAAWMAVERACDQRLCEALWGAAWREAEAPIARQVALSCRGDLPTWIALALHLDRGGAPADPPTGNWSGTVEVRLPWGMRLLLNAAAVRALLPSEAADLASRPVSGEGGCALAPLAEAIAMQRVPLHVVLSDCALDVAALQDLQVGDVVPLEHRLEVPMQVRDGRGQPLFGGFLARRCGFKAVELASLPARAPAAQSKVVP